MHFLFAKIVLIGLAATFPFFDVASADNIWVDQPACDFGVVPPNATVVYRSWLHNGGEDSLFLRDTKTGCGCLAANPVGSSVPPGDSIPITLPWQTRALDGPVTRSAYLYLEGWPDPLKIELSGRPGKPTDSTSGVGVSAAVVKFDSIGASYRSLRLRNLSETEFFVQLLLAPDSVLRVEFPPTLPFKGEGVVVVSLDPVSRTLPFEDSFTLEFKSQAGYTYRLTVPVVNGDFSHRPVFTKTEL